MCRLYRHEILTFSAYRCPGAPEIGGILRGQALGKAFGYSGEYDLEEVQIQLQEAIKAEDFIRKNPSFIDSHSRYPRRDALSHSPRNQCHTASPYPPLSHQPHSAMPHCRTSLPVAAYRRRRAQAAPRHPPVRRRHRRRRISDGSARGAGNDLTTPIHQHADRTIPVSPLPFSPSSCCRLRFAAANP